MNSRKRLQQMAFLVLVVLFLVGCGASQETPTPLSQATTITEPTEAPTELTATQVEPTASPVFPTKTPNPTSCQEVEGTCLGLSFDGEACTYREPTDLNAGLVTFLFLNKSEGGAAAGMVRHKGDKNIQDAKDTFVEEPSTGHAPAWTIRLINYKGVPPAESYLWEGILEPGIHTMVCAKFMPQCVWFGGGFKVEERSD